MKLKLFVALMLLVLVVACGTNAPTPPPPAVQPSTQTVAPTAPATPRPPVQPTAPVARVQKLEATPRIAVESAFGPELTLILSKMQIEKSYVVNGRTFTAGKLVGKDVITFLSGVSMVNAAMTTQQAFDNFNITHLLFSGIAGGVNPNLNVGDVVVPAFWSEYQETRFAREKADGTYAGVASDLPNFGMAFPQTVGVVRKGGEADKVEQVRWFKADPALLEVARKVSVQAVLSKCGKDRAGNPVCLSHDPVYKVGGNGVAGPTFVDNAKFRSYAWDTFQADALDMESAAVAHVAYNNAVPFVIFRSLSDLAGGGPGENEIGTFFALAADNSANALVKFVEIWSPAAVAPPLFSKPLVFACIYVGPANDHGWSEAHHTACQSVEKNLPGSKLISLDKVNPASRPGTTFGQVADEMIRQGARLIFATSDDFQDETRLSASKNPGVTFVMVSGDDVLQKKNPLNLGNYMGRMEYGKMIAGCAAALSTQTGKIGYLGPLINNETRRLVVSAYLGARYCWEKYRGKDPGSLVFEVRWIGFWFNIPGVTLDPTKVASDFYNGGFDVVLSGIDTTEGLVVAGQQARSGKAVYAIPYDFKGACDEAPAVCLGVPYFNWGPGYLKIARAVSDGSWKPEFLWEGPDWKDINNDKTSAIGWVHGQALKSTARAQVEEFTKALGSGSLNLFQGPLVLQDGLLYLKDGEKASDSQIWFLPQLLKGMIGASR